MAKVFPRNVTPEQFRPPLNSGEAKIFDYLKNWEDDWTIYVQPNLGTSKPDFIALNDKVGVFVIEVKDWNPDLYRRNTESKHKYAIEVYSNNQWNRTGHDPRRQTSNYKRDIFDYFFASTESPQKDDEFIKAVLILPQFNSRDAKLLVDLEPNLTRPSRSQNAKTFGAEFPDELKKLKTVGQRPPPIDQMHRIRQSLLEPEFVSDQRMPLNLSGGAKNISDNPNKAIRRRVRGCSGSGKSLGLAHRAAKLALEGKSVLVLSFNITLSHYLRDLARRAIASLDPQRSDPTAMRRITFTHFFNLICTPIECQWTTTYGEDLWDLRVAEAQSEYSKIDSSGLAIAKTGAEIKLYDAILIDEGQDFKQLWWDFLRDFVLVKGGEMLLVCDQAQDTYERGTWLEEMKGFGPWTELKESYRVPPDLLPFMKAIVQENALGSSHLAPESPSDRQLSLWPSTILNWTNAKTTPEIIELVFAEVKRLTSAGDLAYTDITILCEQHEIGRDVFDVLRRNKNLTTSHIFVKDGGSNPKLKKLSDTERQTRKKRFWGGSGGIKGSTIQSFKGWESKAIIYIAAETFDPALAFIAISRVKGEIERPAVLTIVNSSPQFTKYQKYFENII
jgi:hypothetical protein